MYVDTNRSAWAKADRTGGVLGLAAEHCSNATHSRQFQPRANESIPQNFVRRVRELGQLPNGGLLEPEEELALASDWRAHGDVDARNKIVEAHAPLIWGIAKELWLKARAPKDRPNETFVLADCIGAGCVGALEACKRFNPNYGVRFAAYARPWIFGEIKEYLSRATSVVKGSAFDVEFDDESPRPLPAENKAAQGNEIAPRPASPIDGDTREYDSVSPSGQLTPLTPDEVTPTAAPPSIVSPEAFLVSASTQEDALIASQIPRLRAAVSELKERERVIFEARCLADQPVTLAELAERFSISIERVRQIEKSADKKVGELFFGVAAQGVQAVRRGSVAPLPDRCAWPGGVTDADSSWPCAWPGDEIAKYFARFPAPPVIKLVRSDSDWRPQNVVVAKRWTDCKDKATATVPVLIRIGGGRWIALETKYGSERWGASSYELRRHARERGKAEARQ